MSHRQTDQQLVDAANRGDACGFEALYERYNGWAVAVAMRFTNDREAACDVTHDAFIWLLSKFPGFVLRAQMKTVLYPVLRNIALTHKRRTPPQTLDEDTPAESEKALGDDAHVLHNALQQLPVGQREAVVLCYADELSHAEIANVLGIPVGTVKSRLHLAIKTLRDNPYLRDIFEIQ